MMENERQVRLFRNGRNQAVRIPRDFEMKGSAVLIRKEGDRLILEPLGKPGLLSVLAGLGALDEIFPDVDDSLLPADDVRL